ncbi:MAG: hypothetical protein SNJ78_08385 [Spirochaetales bacterium]
MNLNRQRIGLAVFCIFLFLFSAFTLDSVSSLEFREDSFYFFYDVLWLGNSDKDSAPSPLIGVVGGGWRFFLSESFAIEPEIGFYGAEYFYREGKAYPAEIEYADAVGVLGVLISPLIYYRYTLRPGSLFLHGALGPTLSFKIPLVPHGNAPSSEVANYFLSGGRFFYFELRSTLDWSITNALGLTVRLRSVLPTFQLWNGEPFYDQLFLGGGVALRISY